MSKWPEWPVILNAGVIEKLQAERDAAYGRGFAAGVEQAERLTALLRSVRTKYFCFFPLEVLYEIDAALAAPPADGEPT